MGGRTRPVGTIVSLIRQCAFISTPATFEFITEWCSYQGAPKYRQNKNDYGNILRRVLHDNDRNEKVIIYIYEVPDEFWWLILSLTRFSGLNNRLRIKRSKRFSALWWFFMFLTAQHKSEIELIIKRENRVGRLCVGRTVAGLWKSWSCFGGKLFLLSPHWQPWTDVKTARRPPSSRKTAIQQTASTTKEYFQLEISAISMKIQITLTVFLLF